MDTQRLDTSTDTSAVRQPAVRRKDRRVLTLIILIALISLITTVRLWPFFQPDPEIEGVTTFSNLARDHVAGKWPYPQEPPVGGAHSATWQNCGVYDQIIPNETAVHSLEHGAVWITYRPALQASDVERLRGLAQSQRYILLSPYPDQPAMVMATAWGTQLRLDSSNDLRLPTFIDTYAQGVQTPEPGASCSGGEGRPMNPEQAE